MTMTRRRRYVVMAKQRINNRALSAALVARSRHINGINISDVRRGGKIRAANSGAARTRLATIALARWRGMRIAAPVSITLVSVLARTRRA